MEKNELLAHLLGRKKRGNQFKGGFAEKGAINGQDVPNHS